MTIDIQGGGGPSFTVAIGEGEPVTVSGLATGVEAVHAIAPAIEKALFDASVKAYDAGYSKGATEFGDTDSNVEVLAPVLDRARRAAPKDGK